MDTKTTTIATRIGKIRMALENGAPFHKIGKAAPLANAAAWGPAYRV